MACMQCGSDEVANFQYCRRCLEIRRGARNQSREQAYSQFRKEDSKFDQTLANPLTWIGGAVLLYLVMFAVFLLGPTGELGVLVAFLFATIGMGIFLTALSAWLIRVKRVVGNSEAAAYRHYWILNIGSVAITVLACWGLSVHLGVSIFEARTLVESVIFNRELPGEEGSYEEVDATYFAMGEDS